MTFKGIKRHFAFIKYLRDNPRHAKIYKAYKRWKWDSNIGTYNELKRSIRDDNKAFVEIVCSGFLDDKTIVEMYSSFSHVRLTKDKNRHMFVLNNMLRENRSKLPETFAICLDWLLNTHGY